MVCIDRGMLIWPNICNHSQANHRSTLDLIQSKQYQNFKTSIRKTFYTVFSSFLWFIYEVNVLDGFISNEKKIIRCFEYIEEMIHKQESIVSVLRLLVLFSLTNAGLPKKHFDYLRYIILHFCDSPFMHISCFEHTFSEMCIYSSGVRSSIAMVLSTCNCYIILKRQVFSKGR